jgi:hypothetical protein
MLGAGCAVLAELFSSLDRSFIRLSFETLALTGCGLFVAELVRNRRMSVKAQEMTAKARERLRALVKTSPAAIVTVDERGFVELANRAAVELMPRAMGTSLALPSQLFFLSNIMLRAGKKPPVSRVHSMPGSTR